MKYSRITGTGSYLPEKVLTNKDLEDIIDTSDEWIRGRTGIHKRHVVTDGESCSQLAEAAAMFKAALAVNPADRDAQRWLNRVQQAMAEAETQDQDAGPGDAAEDAEDDAGRSDTNESGA